MGSNAHAGYFGRDATGTEATGHYRENGFLVVTDALSAEERAELRDIVMVAGRDPYAAKGIEDIAKPHVRPAGEGGCGNGRVDVATFKEQIRQDRSKAFR